MDAIVLLSGGLDSGVLLGFAASKGLSCLALSFDYGQRHQNELNFAKNLCEHYQTNHKIITLDPQHFATSSLVNQEAILKDRTEKEMAENGIPNTYVPARNTLFLSYAMGMAEIMGAKEIYFGANQLDRSGYPDTRPAYLDAMQNIFNLGSKQAVEETPPILITPLQDLDKAGIIKLGQSLSFPFEKTFSCYDPAKNHEHCGRCDACILRKNGFQKANVQDPTLYSTA